jgi:hypothetical protein
MEHFAGRILRFIRKLTRIVLLSLSALFFLALLTASVWLFFQGEVGMAIFLALASLSGGIVVSHIAIIILLKYKFLGCQFLAHRSSSG